MMPSLSKKQHNFMALVANNPAAAKRLKVPQSVGEDFMNADKGKKFKEGGASMKADLMQDKKVVKKAFSMHDKQSHGGKSTDLTKLKKGGMPFEMSKKDVESKGMKEGSKREEAFDRMQMMKKPAMKFAAGGHIKRFSKGSEVSNYEDNRASEPVYEDNRASEPVFDETTGKAIPNMRKSRDDGGLFSTEEKPSLDSMKFGDAFKERRAAGAKTFDWRGTTYNTDMTKPTSKSAASLPAASADSGASSTGKSQIPGQSLTEEQRKGINAGERITGTDFSRNALNTMSALTPVGGGLGKVGAEMVMGRRGAQAAQAATKGREAVTNPAAWMAGPKGMNIIQKSENVARRAAEKAAKAKERLKNQIPDSATSGGAIGYKSGGAIKKFAKGGSVISASSRGDGIAQRGKTKGTLSKMKSGGMYGGKGAC
jgi:hypothetical protein